MYLIKITMQKQSQPPRRTNKDYYEILGVKTDASAKEIDEAYKKLSSQWHPDKNKTNRKEAESKFTGISEAYDVLSNQNRRAHYDDMNHREYGNEDADKIFERFYDEHGFEDESEKEFFNKHYPNRKRNYYEILGIPKNSNRDDIKKAYRKLALQYHPKNNEGNEEARRRFNEVNEAYNALSSEPRRQNYDIIEFGQIAPIRANNIFENFWGDRWNQIEEADDQFRPMLNKKWSKDLDRWMREGNNDDWSSVNQGESFKTESYYTNKNGIESKKSISTKTKYENGVPTTETTEEYEFPDGNKEVRKIKDDGKGNVTSNVYNLKKGEALPIEN